jgi:hypothetical protein
MFDNVNGVHPGLGCGHKKGKFFFIQEGEDFRNTIINLIFKFSDLVEALSIYLKRFLGLSCSIASKKSLEALY